MSRSVLPNPLEASFCVFEPAEHDECPDDSQSYGQSLVDIPCRDDGLEFDWDLCLFRKSFAQPPASFLSSLNFIVEYYLPWKSEVTRLCTEDFPATPESLPLGPVVRSLSLQ